MTDDERSPRKKAASVNEDNEIAKEINMIGLPDDLKCTSENDDSIMNRSLSAPPVLVKDYWRLTFARCLIVFCTEDFIRLAYSSCYV